MYDLMEQAGQAAFKLVFSHCQQLSSVLVLVGTGNNGGDGYVLARLLKVARVQVVVASINPQKELVGDALTAKNKWLDQGGSVAELDDLDWQQFDVVVDALLGTGVSGQIKDDYAQAIHKINSTEAYVVSLDIPSGISANTGASLGSSVKASCTITFVGIKKGLTTGVGKHYCGKLIFAPLAIGEEFNRLAKSTEMRISFADYKPLAARMSHSHKGHYGRLLCIGGNRGMSGAIRLSAEAAMRSGAGLVKVFCHAHSIAQVSNGRPELMISSDNLAQQLYWADCIIVGPGLGQDPWSHEIFNQVISYLVHEDKPVVFDADGLNLLSQRLHKFSLSKMILTPHPVEAARLLKTTVAEIETDRFNSALRLQQQYFASVVLKGAGSLVQTTKQTRICQDGNPGMATAGMGDVLAGILGGLLSQGLNSEDAACYGTCLHSAAADRAASDHGQRGMLASDIFAHLRTLIN